MSHMEASEQGEEFMTEPRHPWHFRTRVLEGELVRQWTESLQISENEFGLSSLPFPETTKPQEPDRAFYICLLQKTDFFLVYLCDSSCVLDVRNSGAIAWVSGSGGACTHVRTKVSQASMPK